MMEQQKGPCVVPWSWTLGHRLGLVLGQKKGPCMSVRGLAFFFFCLRIRANPARTLLMHELCGLGQIDPDLNGLNFKQPNPPFWWVEPSWLTGYNPL